MYKVYTITNRAACLYSSQKLVGGLLFIIQQCIKTSNGSKCNNVFMRLLGFSGLLVVF